MTNRTHMTVEGEVRLGLVHTNQPEGDYFVIEVEDEASSVRFIRLKIPFKEGSKLLAHRATKCEVELTGLGLVGAKREVKTEWVPGSITKYDDAGRKAQADAALAPYLLGGWRPHRDDFGNPHKHKRIDGVDGYNVGFVRFIRPDGTPVT